METFERILEVMYRAWMAYLLSCLVFIVLNFMNWQPELWDALFLYKIFWFVEHVNTWAKLLEASALLLALHYFILSALLRRTPVFRK